MDKLLIDISQEDDYTKISDNEDNFDSDADNSYQSSKEEINFDDKNGFSKTIYLVHNEEIDSDDPNISEFLKFCINKGLFDNTFYDMHNAFSVVATKLPQTFEKLCSGKTDIYKKSFIKKFKSEYGYPGNISFIYDCLDTENKGFITWDEFIDFFLPFVQYVTV
ncbi:hypothetical protein Indivirus_2_102 [Indivirus ILV1]|uniref:EF-hand domain-containing protein n=1 Tax=Indivirus ILV1 TaxID=1977633 RepID=A0A1V0SDC5_9VIRU|nr:hypothetical protein Indivirus_2_102 [Indivirus ILV1]